MVTRRKFLKMGLGGLGGLSFLSLLPGAALFFSKKQIMANPENNPYAYDLSAFKKVKESLISHKEIKRIKIKANKIYAITIDPADQLFVSADKKILRFNKNLEPDGEFILPEPGLCLATDKKDELFMGMKDHVETANTASWTGHNQIVVSPGEKVFISGIAVKGNSLAVADQKNKMIWLYSRNGTLKKIIKDFLLPSPDLDVAFNKSGELWATHPGKLRMEKYDLNGRLLTYWGKASFSLEGFSGCDNPVHFALMPNGNVVTVEKGLVRIKLYDPKGKLLSVVASPESFQERTSGLSLAVDSESKIYIVDQYYKAIRIFGKK